jgi:hypothetical protein
MDLRRLTAAATYFLKKLQRCDDATVQRFNDLEDGRLITNDTIKTATRIRRNCDIALRPHD